MVGQQHSRIWADDYFKEQIAKEIFKSKIEALPINEGFNIAFGHYCSFVISALQGQRQRFHSRHLRVVLVMEPVLVSHVMPAWKSLQWQSRLWAPGMTEKTCTVVDNFQFAANRILKVIFTMCIMFSSGSFLKISFNLFLLLPQPRISWWLWQGLVSHWYTQQQKPVAHCLQAVYNWCTTLPQRSCLSHV